MKLLCHMLVRSVQYGVQRMPEISARADWTIEETGELVKAVDLLRTPGEIASALQREEEDVRAKIAELGLSIAKQPSTAP